MEGYANLKAMLETTIQRLEESSGASGGEVRKGKRLLRELKNANEMALERGKRDDYSEKVSTVTDFINQNRGELDEDNITDDGLGEGRRRHIKTKGRKTRKKKYRGGMIGWQHRLMAPQIDLGPEGGPKREYYEDLEHIREHGDERESRRAAMLIITDPEWFDNNVEDVNEFVQGYFNRHRGGQGKKKTKKSKKNRKNRKKTKKHKKGRKFTSKRSRRH